MKIWSRGVIGPFWVAGGGKVGSNTVPVYRFVTYSVGNRSKIDENLVSVAISSKQSAARALGSAKTSSGTRATAAKLAPGRPQHASSTMRHVVTSVLVVSRSRNMRIRGPLTFARSAGQCTKGLAWIRQKGDPCRNGPATRRPFESFMELCAVIWHLFPARVIPVHADIVCEWRILRA